MASIVSVNLVSGKDKFTQKCIFPTKLMENTNLKINDYVTIQTSEKKYICQLCMTTLPLTCIFVDDVVTSVKFPQSESFNHWESANIPDDLTCIKPFTYEHITIKIVHKDNEDIVHCDKTVYEVVIRELLAGYVIEKDCVVNCSDLKLADLFHIYCIVISEAFPEIYQYGKIIKTSKIEIIDIISKDQMCQIDDFQNIQLGGISEKLNIFKLNLKETSPSILVTGPFGCGKSSFVKKFCSNTKCFFNVVDGLKITELTSNKFNVIKRKFSSHLKMFPSITCVLFIDHIDFIAPYDLKQKSLIITSALVNIINHLKDKHVIVIATAAQRNNINPKISSLFEREVNLGIPSLQQRKEMIKSLTKSLICHINFDKIAQMTPGFVGHDISLLVHEAINVKKRIENTEKPELTEEDFQKALLSISPSVLKTSPWMLKVKPIYWKDIGGMFNIKRRLQMCIEWPLHNPEIFKKVGLPCPHGVLLFGPPGCCKTTLARGLATECNANFFAANPAQIYSPYVGESEKNISELFYQARLGAPSIIFLDELDSLVSQRKLDQKSQGIGEKVLSALLNEMDGFGTKVQFPSSLNMQNLLNNEAFENLNENKDEDRVKYYSNDVIVVAATNRPDLIDDALLRPGRFDIILYVPPPNNEERESILLTLTKEMPIKNVDMKNITESTHLFSGADLKNLCNEAAMNALRNDISALYITEENFKEALQKIQPSITEQQIEMYEKLSSKYGPVIK